MYLNNDRHIHAHDLWGGGEDPANDHQESETVSAHRCASDYDYMHERVAQMQQSREVHVNAQHANHRCQKQKMNVDVSDYANENDRPAIWSSVPTSLGTISKTYMMMVTSHSKHSK